MSNKHLKNRHHNESLKNIAIWGYWENCGRYMPGTERENAIWIEALAGAVTSRIFINFSI